MVMRKSPDVIYERVLRLGYQSLESRLQPVKGEESLTRDRLKAGLQHPQDTL
jgi:hypothetical protein